ncbi:MAG: S8 family serine peptidase [Muribaculaceae bacterium]|nr:S8 family serine peptidase [Muribaculaceae bacterium]
MEKFVIYILLCLAALPLSAQQRIDNHRVSRGVLDICHRQAASRADMPLKDSRFLALLTFVDPAQSPEVLSQYGCRVVDHVGRIHIVEIPVSQVAALSCDPRIERIEAERMPRPAMDVTPGQINATQVYTGMGLPQAFEGRGVVAGVFDTGFDVTHPAFSDADGNLRVKYYYDFYWPNADGTRGRALTTTDEIAAYGHSQYTSSSIHGTHVMGTMAGSPVQGKYRGMAPESDIYIADFKSNRAEFENPDEQTSALVVLGFKYLFDRAAAQGRPCVVNFSSCESLTLTRQRTLEGEALRQLVGPGRIIVAAAGNDGFRSAYMEKGEDEYQAGVGLINGVGSGEVLDIDIVTPVNQRVRFDFFGFKLLGGGIEGTIIFDTDSIDSLQGDTCLLTTQVSMGEISLKVYKSDYQDDRGSVYHVDGHMPNLAYLLLCGGACLLTGDGPAWMYSDLFLSPFTNIIGSATYSHAAPGYSVSWPATLDGIISVGATGYKNTFVNIDGQTNTDMLSFVPDQPGHVTVFSSRGPTFDGRIKPTVVAPGLNINAAYNSFSSSTESDRKSLTDKVTVDGKTYYYIAESGTSMASPVVAGAVALWLEADPTLTPERITEVLEHTATKPDASMTYPNNTYGYGQIDVYKGLLYILGAMDNIPNLSTHQPRQARIDVRDNRLHVDMAGDAAGQVTIYTPDGQQALAATLDRDGTLDLSSLLPGQVYAVQLDTADPMTTGSTLIRP